MIGRPCRLTPELQAELVASLARVYHVEIACDLCGLHRTTVYRWIKRGKHQKRGKYREFCNAIKKALAEKMAASVSAIEAAKEWTAHAWLLERKWPALWGADRTEIAKLARELEQALVGVRALETLVEKMRSTSA
jgi:hypothetical protein